MRLSATHSVYRQGPVVDSVMYIQKGLSDRKGCLRRLVPNEETGINQCKDDFFVRRPGSTKLSRKETIPFVL